MLTALLGPSRLGADRMRPAQVNHPIQLNDGRYDSTQSESDPPRPWRRSVPGSAHRAAPTGVSMHDRDDAAHRLGESVVPLELGPPHRIPGFEAAGTQPPGGLGIEPHSRGRGAVSRAGRQAPPLRRAGDGPCPVRRAPDLHHDTRPPGAGVVCSVCGRARMNVSRTRARASGSGAVSSPTAWRICWRCVQYSLNPPLPGGRGFLAQAASENSVPGGLTPSAPAGLRPARSSIRCAEFLSLGLETPHAVQV